MVRRGGSLGGAGGWARGVGGCGAESDRQRVIRDTGRADGPVPHLLLDPGLDLPAADGRDEHGDRDPGPRRRIAGGGGGQPVRRAGRNRLEPHLARRRDEPGVELPPHVPLLPASWDGGGRQPPQRDGPPADRPGPAARAVAAFGPLRTGRRTSWSTARVISVPRGGSSHIEFLDLGPSNGLGA